MDADVNSISESDIYFAQHQPPAIMRSRASLGLKEPQFPFIATAAELPKATNANKEKDPLAAIFIPSRMLREANTKFGVTMSGADFYKNIITLHEEFASVGLSRGDCFSRQFVYAVGKGNEALGTLVATTTVCRVAARDGEGQDDVYVVPESAKNFSIEFHERQRPSWFNETKKSPSRPAPFVPATRANQWM